MEEHKISVLFLTIVTLLATVLVLAKALHDRPKLNSFLSEPGMVLLVGIAVSLVVSFFAGFNDFVDADEAAAAAADAGDDNIFKMYDEDQAGESLLKLMFSFPKEVFFFGFLPPILFNSGYELQREMFFRHIKAIGAFAVIGTLVSGFSTGFILYGVREAGWLGDFAPATLELLTFGALIAATDTVSVLGVLKSKQVDPHLFNLVFGESALNDAVALVLFNSLSKVLVEDADNNLNLAHEAKMFVIEFSMIAVGSPVLGIIFSFFTAILFKRMDLRKHSAIELCLYILLMYVPYMMAEVFHLSGIVTIFFCGMSARRYIEPNLSFATAKNAEAIFHAIAYLAETCIFLCLGLSCFGYIERFHWRFIGFGFVASLIGRALSIYPISFLYNCSLKERVTDSLLALDEEASLGSMQSSGSMSSSKRQKIRSTPARRQDRKIPPRFMHVLWFAGLRGAVAYACAKNFPNVYGHENDMVTSTMVIVLINVLVMGGFTDALLNCLKIRMGVDEKEYMKTWHKQRKLKGTFHRFENDYIYKVVVREGENDIPVKPKHGYQNPEIIDTMYQLQIMELAEIDETDSQSEMDPEGMVVETKSETESEHR
ncbi:unnamed protein product [Cylindrotheca closterium]|uniref:Cation/H+ exchanger transmembrane domain-containing protein n=1 Tax=Cylindrotheca closterium TaxID=2856 RepID=A0AAD2FI32_9STRA|nr:unnamed protein product [Cylindrotheca closterium]